jgi:hypothetical protein
MKVLKILPLLFFFTSIWNSSQAQLEIGLPKGRWDDSIDGLLTSTATIAITSENLDEFEGHPYLDEDFKTGKAVFGDKELNNIPLRYNVVFEDIETKMDGDVMVINNKEAVVYIKGKKYVFMDYKRDGKSLSGYFQVVAEPKGGMDGATLLLKHYKVLRDGGPMRIGDEAPPKDELDDESSYYILIEKEPMKIEKGEDEFLMLFPEEDRAKIKEYMEKERLKPRKDKDLIQIVEYYNQ